MVISQILRHDFTIEKLSEFVNIENTENWRTSNLNDLGIVSFYLNCHQTVTEIINKTKKVTNIYL